MKRARKTQVSLQVVAGAVIGSLLLVACADEPAPGTTAKPAGKEEPPYFVIDPQASGPLTLAELQINVPDDIKKRMSDAEQACFYKAVERRAEEAGDPATLDPEDFDYWGGKTRHAEWDRFDSHMRRVLVAQAVITWGMLDCT